MATAVTATATNDPVHAAHRISPCANIAGECSKKKRKKASNTEISGDSTWDRAPRPHVIRLPARLVGATGVPR
jgi:hypothetical protein